VLEDVLEQRLAGQEALKAVMMESHLVSGRQDPAAVGLIYGQSVTDACLEFEDTKRAIEAVATRLA
jgi:3-deoxy-7-phosphoheptulonate synthase